MKIVYIFPHFAQKAGTERILINKMNFLSDFGYNIIALTYEQGEHPFAFPLSKNVKHVDLNVRFFPLFRYNAFIRIFFTLILRQRLINRLRSFVKKNSPDLIVSTTYASFEIMALSHICRSSSVSFIVESHSTYHYSFSSDIYSMLIHRQRHLKRSQLFGVSAVVALTDGDAEDWKKVVNRVTVIPNFVQQNTSGRYSNGESRNVVFVGRMVEQKGLPELLSIWALVHRRFPNWNLHVYGTGPLKKWFCEEITHLKNRIIVHDPVSDISEVYLNSSILVLPSMYEPFGLVLVEAMGYGVPVVSFDCPYGPNSIITDGEDGFIVKNRSVSDFADRVCQLIEDRELRTRMGQNAIKSSQRYSADNIMPIWKAFFESV